MDIRPLQYLASLARERHFTRAASACNVTQSTLSGRTRQFEQELGVPIVERGQRFRCLTPEGERVPAWAQQILGNCEAMSQELAAMKRDLTGPLVLGVIPSALPTTPPLTEAVRRRFRGLSFAIHAQTSNAMSTRRSNASVAPLLPRRGVPGQRGRAPDPRDLCPARPFPARNQRCTAAWMRTSSTR